MKFTNKTISEVADVIAGQSPPSNLYNKTGNGLPFYQGKTDFGEKYPEAKTWCTGAKTKEAIQNDILLSVRAPVGPVNICQVRSVIGRGLSAIRAKKGNSFEYLFYYLKNHEQDIAKLGTGSTFKAITQTHINRIQLPIPESFDDQIRIATVLIRAEQLIAKRKESIKALDKLLKSTFLEMFGDPVRNEKGWEMKPLHHLTKVGTGGTPSRKKEAEYYNGNIFWAKTSEVNGNYIYDTSEKISELAISESNCKIYPVHTILLAMYGQGKTRGNAGYLRIEAATNQACAAILPSGKINQIFLFQFLKNSYEFLRSLARGGNQENLNLNIVGNVEIFVPPLPLQNQFAAIVGKVESIKTKQAQSLAKLENFYASLSQRAFKGELDLSRVPVVYVEAEPLETKSTISADVKVMKVFSKAVMPE